MINEKGLDMFVRCVKKKSRKGKDKQYLYLLKSVREGSKVRSQTVMKIGERYKASSQEKIKDLLCQLSKFSTDDEVLDVKKDIQLMGCSDYGVVVIFRKLWEQLGLSDIVQACFEGEQDRAGELIFMHVLYRLMMREFSLPSIDRWRKTVYVPDLKDLGESDFQTILGELSHKKTQLMDTFVNAIIENGKDTQSLVLYVTETLYVPDLGKEPIGLEDRDSEDLGGVVNCILYTDEGMPIYYESWDVDLMNHKDVMSMITDVKERYHIDQIVFVCKEERISKRSVDFFKKVGYPYILISNIYNLEEEDERNLLDEEAFKPLNASLYSDISVNDLRIEGSGRKTRYIVYRDAKKRAVDIQRKDRFKSIVCRQVSIKFAKEWLIRKGAWIISNGLKKFVGFQSAGNSININNEIEMLNQHEIFLGKTMVTTNLEISLEKIWSMLLNFNEIDREVQSFQNEILNQVPNVSTRELVEGHVLVIFLMVLIKRFFVLSLQKSSGTGTLFDRTSFLACLHQLNQVKVMEIAVNGRVGMFCSELSPFVESVFQAFGVEPLSPTLKNDRRWLSNGTVADELIRDVDREAPMHVVCIEGVDYQFTTEMVSSLLQSLMMYSDGLYGLHILKDIQPMKYSWGYGYIYRQFWGFLGIRSVLTAISDKKMGKRSFSEAVFEIVYNDMMQNNFQAQGSFAERLRYQDRSELGFKEDFQEVFQILGKHSDCFIKLGSEGNAEEDNDHSTVMMFYVLDINIWRGKSSSNQEGKDRVTGTKMVGLCVSSKGEVLGVKTWMNTQSSEQKFRSIFKDIKKKYAIEDVVLVCCESIVSESIIASLDKSGFTYVIRQSVAFLQSENAVLTVSKDGFEVLNELLSEQIIVKEDVVEVSNTQDRQIIFIDSNLAKKDAKKRQFFKQILSDHVDKYSAKVWVLKNNEWVIRGGYRNYIVFKGTRLTVRQALDIDKYEFQDGKCVWRTNSDYSNSEVFACSRRFTEIESMVREFQNQIDDLPFNEVPLSQLEGKFIAHFLRYVLEENVKLHIKNGVCTKFKSGTEGIDFSELNEHSIDEITQDLYLSVLESLEDRHTALVKIKDKKYQLWSEFSDLESSVFDVLNIPLSSLNLEMTEEVFH